MRAERTLLARKAKRRTRVVDRGRERSERLGWLSTYPYHVGAAKVRKGAITLQVYGARMVCIGDRAEGPGETVNHGFILLAEELECGVQAIGGYPGHTQSCVTQR